METDFVWIHNDEDILEEEKKMCVTCGGALGMIEDNVFKCTDCGTIYNFQNML